jgi:hypothetical protein
MNIVFFGVMRIVPPPPTCDDDPDTVSSFACPLNATSDGCEILPVVASNHSSEFRSCTSTSESNDIDDDEVDSDNSGGDVAVDVDIGSGAMDAVGVDVDSRDVDGCCDWKDGVDGIGDETSTVLDDVDRGFRGLTGANRTSRVVVASIVSCGVVMGISDTFPTVIPLELELDCGCVTSG